MRASLYKITTDNEGSSRIIFDIPSSELAEAVKLNLLFRKEVELSVAIVPEPEPMPMQPLPEREPIL